MQHCWHFTLQRSLLQARQICRAADSPLGGLAPDRGRVRASLSPAALATIGSACTTLVAALKVQQTADRSALQTFFTASRAARTALLGACPALGQGHQPGEGQGATGPAGPPLDGPCQTALATYRVAVGGDRQTYRQAISAAAQSFDVAAKAFASVVRPLWSLVNPPAATAPPAGPTGPTGPWAATGASGAWGQGVSGPTGLTDPHRRPGDPRSR